MKQKQPYIAKVALEMVFPEERYSTNRVPLAIRSRGNGSRVPIAIAQAIHSAFEHPSIKRKSPTYIRISVKVLSRWVLDDMPDEVAFANMP